MTGKSTPERYSRFPSFEFLLTPSCPHSCLYIKVPTDAFVGKLYFLLQCTSSLCWTMPWCQVLVGTQEGTSRGGMQRKGPSRAIMVRKADEVPAAAVVESSSLICCLSLPRLSQSRLNNSRLSRQMGSHFVCLIASNITLSTSRPLRFQVGEGVQDLRCSRPIGVGCSNVSFDRMYSTAEQEAAAGVWIMDVGGNSVLKDWQDWQKCVGKWFGSGWGVEMVVSLTLLNLEGSSRLNNAILA